ncbi:glycosyltransferase [Patescibacteria group bacterium]|nr:glycosyltransferase [Patescibacteria group bacterium]MBU1755015.1 glycosyltransferase [Patescibacteria group bacterium]
MSKKVLIFSLNYYPRFTGGAEVAIKEITDRISPEEMEFHMVTLRFDSNLPRTELVGNITVHRIGPAVKNPTISDLRKFPLHFNKHLYQFLAAAKALSLHKQIQFDATWAMMAHSCAVPAGIFKTLKPDVPYLLTLQEGDPPENIERLARPVWPLFKRGFTTADAMQPISNFLLAWGLRMGFKGVSKVIPNAVDTAHFSYPYAVEEINRIKKALGKNEGDIFVVTTSRLVHKNGIDIVIRALPLLPENVFFLIYGIGPEEDKYRKLAEEIGVAARTRFMGQIEHDEMPLMLKACDIFARPSRSEGMGNSFIEAMAADLPVIATQVGGIADFLFDSEKNTDKDATGWAVEMESEEEIARAIRDIMENPAKAEKVVANAKAMVLSNYDWSQITSDMKKLLIGIMK